jgi:hypothetical protein
MGNCLSPNEIRDDLINTGIISRRLSNIPELNTYDPKANKNIIIAYLDGYTEPELSSYFLNYNPCEKQELLYNIFMYGNYNIEFYRFLIKRCSEAVSISSPLQILDDRLNRDKMLHKDKAIILNLLRSALIKELNP